MSSEHKEGWGIFNFFLFFLMGILFRQVGFMLKLKAVHHVPLFIAGTFIGFYLLDKEESKPEIPILSSAGCIWFYNAYIPIYYFLATFNLDRDALNIRLISYILLVCLPIWIITIFSVVALIEYFFDVPFERKELAIMTMITLVPDVHMTKLFISSKFTFASQDVCSLFQCECIAASLISSILYLLFLTGSCDDLTELSMFCARTTFTITCSLLLGKIAIAAVFRMHYDPTNQISIVMVFIYLTFGIATLGEAPGDLAVVTLGIMMMESKPRLTQGTIDMINRFFEIIRFGIVSSFGIIFGIAFTVRFHNNFLYEDLVISGIIYIVTYGCRFVIITGIALITHKVFFQTMQEAFTVSAAHLRGVFSIILILSFRESHLKLPMENDRLFVLAGFQVALSIFITTTMAASMATIQRRYTFDREKIMMVHQAVKLMNSYKESLVCMLRRMTFTADADWDIVTERTMIRKSFLVKYEYKEFMSRAKAQTPVTDKEVRETAIKDLLRLQRRFIEEQFRHGTLGGRSAAFFASYIRKCLHRKELMSAKHVINGMAPKKAMLVIHKDLARDSKNGNFYIFRSFFVVMILCIDLYLLLFSTMTCLFLYSDLNHYIIDFSVVFGLCICALSLIAIIYTGQSYLHLYARSMWNWISWLVFLCSVGALLIETLPGFIQHKMYVKRSVEIHSISDFILIPFSSGLTLLRALLLSCCLESVQHLVANFLTLVLDKATSSQCDACQGFLQATVDTAQILDNRMENENLAMGAHTILHRESLAARQFLGVMNMLTPDVIAALKARIACRLVLMTQESIIQKLHHSAVLDVQEIELLTETVQGKLKTLSSFLPALPEPSDEEIIENIAWVCNSRLSYIRLRLSGDGMKMNVDDLILSEGDQTPGLFIILDGLVRVESILPGQISDQQRPDTLNQHLRRTSVNNTTTNSNDVIEFSDFFTRGNIIGEFPLLTGMGSHKTYRCVTDVRLVSIPREKMFDLLGGRPKWGVPMSLPELSLWGTVANRFAARLIQKSASYHLLTKRQIYMMMEDAYVIDAGKEETIDLTHVQRAAVILVYGEVYSPSTQQIYKGPCILPSNLLQLNPVMGYKRHGSVVEPVTRSVIFVLRSFKSMRLGKLMAAIRESQVFDLGDEESDLTISSGSSDGVPYVRKKTVHMKGQERHPSSAT